MNRLWLMVCCATLMQASSDIKYDLSNLAGQRNVVSMVVIGSGPAGCAAATYGARAGMDVLVYEGPLPGGALTETGFVENWPGIKRAKGADIMESQRRQAADAGARIVADTVAEVDFSTWPFTLKTYENSEIKALSVVIATGSESRKLGIPGEKEFWGMGVSACAVCDAPFYEDREVIVIGGGDSAVEQVIQLSPYAKKVVQLVRRDAMRASVAMQNKLRAIKNVTVEYSKDLLRVCGNDADGVTAVDIYDKKTGKTEHRKIDGVFFAIGHLPRTQIFAGKIQLEKDRSITVLGRSQRTTIPGVFAAGDVADNVYRQAGVAAGDGSKAERDVEHFLGDLGLTPTVIRSLRDGTRQVSGLKFYLN
jgi:thioredoxin reductase (NADPH)